MFSNEVQVKLKKCNFDLICEDENIWVLENGDSSVTISGTDDSIEAIWQTFDGEFEEYNSSKIDNIIRWSFDILKLK